MDDNIKNITNALDEYNSKIFDFYRAITDIDEYFNGEDMILNYVETNLKWKSPTEFEKLIINAQLSENFDNSNKQKLDFEEYIENKETIKEFTRIISETTRYMKKGNFDIIPQYVKRLNSITNYDYLSIILGENDIDLEELLNLLDTIVNSIDTDVSFENSEYIIPQNIIELSEEIIYQISKNPELMYLLEPRLFENLISKILLKFKVKTELTKQTRDGGYDIIAIDDEHFSRNKYLIECKRYNPENKVDVSIVRSLYGVKTYNKATKGLLITSSYFTKDAKEFANNNAWELELYDYNDIVNWLRKFWK